MNDAQMSNNPAEVQKVLQAQGLSLPTTAQLLHALQQKLIVVTLEKEWAIGMDGSYKIVDMKTGIARIPQKNEVAGFRAVKNK